jgi:tyrosinase
MVDRFHSKPLELPAAEHEFTRADLVFYGVDHSGPSFEARIFIGAKRGIGPAATAEDPAYAGSFYVFGHGDCYGEAGHCEIPSDRDAFDLRLPHHLEPGLQIVTVTAAVERLVMAGRAKAAVDVFVHGPKRKDAKALDFTGLRLLTYAAAAPGLAGTEKPVAVSAARTA